MTSYLDLPFHYRMQCSKAFYYLFLFMLSGVYTAKYDETKNQHQELIQSTNPEKSDCHCGNKGIHQHEIPLREFLDEENSKNTENLSIAQIQELC